MKKKLFLIILMMFLMVLVSCNGEEPSQTDPPSSEAETEAETQFLTLVAEGEAQYAVILPEGSTGPMREAVNSFADKLSGLYGVKFEVKKNKNLAEGKKLIMIGVQEDDTYASYYIDVAYRDYRIKLTDDGNVVIAAWSLDSIGDCCSKFIMKLKKTYEAGDTLGTLTEDVLVNGVDSSMLDVQIPIYSLTRMPRIYHVQGARGAYELCFKDSFESDWSRYIDVLKLDGFSLIQQSSNSDANFAVLKKDGVEVTVDYWHATKELAVIIDKPAYETSLTAGSVTAVTVPKVIEPGLEYEGALKGMCYVIQGSDGSFVIVDSGDSDPKFLDRLYSVMSPLVPEGEKLHIRAWILTHQHGDHISGFVDIASSKYASLIECDAVYTNMPYSAYQTALENSSYETRYANIEKAAKKLGSDFVIARTGQTYYFADIEVCMLGSVDDMFLTDFNDLDETSLVFTVKTPDKKLIFTGDAGPLYIGQYIMKRYTAATLKSDICQATSHGANHAEHTPFYKAVDPEIYLWPADISFYNRHTPNKYIESDNSAEIIYSYMGTFTIELK